MGETSVQADRETRPFRVLFDGGEEVDVEAADVDEAEFRARFLDEADRGPAWSVVDLAEHHDPVVLELVSTTSELADG